MKRISFLLVLIFLGNEVKAQMLDSTLILEEVEIVSEPIPEMVSFKSTKIKKERIDQNISASLGELLTLNTPIFIKNYGAGGTATPSFRGTGASHTQVYWNGINLNSPMLGQVDLSLFPVAMTDEVSVNYGGASLLYGTGGLGGGIQMNSHLNWDGETHVQFSQTNNSLQNSITNASMTVGNEHVQATTKLFYKDAQNIFDFENPLQPNTPTWVNDHSWQIQYGALQEVAWKLNDHHQVKLDVWYQDSERALTPSMDNEEGDSWQGDTSLRLLGNWKYDDDQFKIDFTTAFINDQLWYRKELNNDDNPKLSTSDSQSTQWQNHFRSSYQISPSLLLKGGVDYTYDQIHSNSYQSVTDSTHHAVSQSTVDVYAGMDWYPVEPVSVSVLMRQEWIDADRKPFLPSLGVEYKWTKGSDVDFALRVNSSKNFHAPSLNDRYWYPVGNPDLLPEEGWTHEGTFSTQWRPSERWKISYEVTAFSSLIHNWIIWKPAVSNLWRPENLKKVHSRGVEQVLEATYQKNDWEVHLFSSLSFVKSENLEAYDELDQSVGKQLIYTPVGSFQGYVQVKYQSFYGIVEQQIYGNRYTQTDGSEYLPAYYLTNVSIGKQWQLNKHTFDLKGRIENVFDYHYQSIARKPMPGRVYQLSLTYKF